MLESLTSKPQFAGELTYYIINMMVSEKHHRRGTAVCRLIQRKGLGVMKGSSIRDVLHRSQQGRGVCFDNE